MIKYSIVTPVRLHDMNTPCKGDKMEMDTFRGVLILHFLSMITPQYHHIFFILWNTLSFSSEYWKITKTSEEIVSFLFLALK